jgi:hypothetical protein
VTIAEAIYVLCAVTSSVAAWLLWRRYSRSRTRLLLWSSIGFVGLAVNNVMVYIDLVMVPANDLALVRTFAAAVGLVVLLCGLIWELGR